MKKTIKLLLSLIVLVIILGFLAYVFYHKKSDTQVVRLGYSGHSLNYSSAMVADEAGFFTNNNVLVEMMPVESGSKTRLALATGKIDMGLLGIADILIAIDAGAPIKILCPVSQASTVVFVRPNEQTKTLADFQGKNIQGESGTSRLWFTTAIIKENFSPTDFNFVDIDKDYRPSALLQQKVLDAIPTSRYNDDMYTKAGAVPLQWWEDNYGSRFSPHTYLTVNTDYAKNHEEEMNNIVKAISQAQSFSITNPENAAMVVAQHIKKITAGLVSFTSMQIIESWQKDLKNIIWSDPQEVLEIVNFLYETKQLKQKLTLEQIFDFRFKNLLEKQQKEIYEN